MNAASTLMSSGIYDFGEVARLLNITDAMVARIALPNASGEAAIVSASHSWAFSFLDVVAMSVVVTLRKAHVGYPEIRQAKKRLERDFDTKSPFAHDGALRTLGVSGGDFVREWKGNWETVAQRQLVFDTPMAVYLRRLHFGSDGLARAWEPVERVLLDPQIQAGAPCVKFTRTQTTVVDGLAKRGITVFRIANELEVDLDGVKAAIDFERRLETDGGLPGIAA